MTFNYKSPFGLMRHDRRCTIVISLIFFTIVMIIIKWFYQAWKGLPWWVNFWLVQNVTIMLWYDRTHWRSYRKVERNNHKRHGTKCYLRHDPNCDPSERYKWQSSDNKYNHPATSITWCKFHPTYDSWTISDVEFCLLAATHLFFIFLNSVFKKNKIRFYMKGIKS